MILELKNVRVKLEGSGLLPSDNAGFVRLKNYIDSKFAHDGWSYSEAEGGTLAIVLPGVPDRTKTDGLTNHRRTVDE